MFLIKKSKAPVEEAKALYDDAVMLNDNSPIVNKSKVYEGTIGLEMSFVGNLKGRGVLNINGVFEGAVELDGEIIVGTNAVVLADIKTKNIIVAGQVHGQIYAQESIKILSTGKVKATLTSKLLSIDKGAMFLGNSIVIEDETIVRNINNEE